MSFKVKAGELWEFINHESSWDRHALVYIVKVNKQTRDPSKDRFEYLTLMSCDTEHVHLSNNHLTIRTNEYGNLWKRLA